MGSFAETTTVDNHLSFADQGKQTSISRCLLQQANGSLLFPFSVCSKQTEDAVFRQFPFFRCGMPETWRHGNMEKCRLGDMANRDMENRDMDLGDMETKSKGK